MSVRRINAGLMSVVVKETRLGQDSRNTLEEDPGNIDRILHPCLYWDNISTPSWSVGMTSRESILNFILGTESEFCFRNLVVSV